MCSIFPAAMASRRSGRIMLSRQILALAIVIGHRKRAIVLRITAATYISTRRSRNDRIGRCLQEKACLEDGRSNMKKLIIALAILVVAGEAGALAQSRTRNN